MSISYPRDKLQWYPTIKYDACTGDRACIEFCGNNVFDWDDEERHPIVQSPLNCVVGCDSCAKICPVEAITFPSKDELRASLKRLRVEFQQERVPVPRQT